MSPDSVKLAITSKTKFILVVHIYGHTPDMDEILSIARTHCIKVIEDAAEAHGAKYKGRMVGGLGDPATFSFYANKLMTTGEGGMVATKYSALAERLEFLRGHAMSSDKRFWHTEIGFNYRLSNLQCAIGVAQLERFQELFDGRDRVIQSYRRILEGTPYGLLVNPRKEFCMPCPWLACVWLPEGLVQHRDAICTSIEQDYGIETRPFFYAVHTMPPYTGFHMHSTTACVGGGTMSEKVASQGFNLPTSLDLTEADILFIASSLLQVLGSFSLQSKSLEITS